MSAWSRFFGFAEGLREPTTVTRATSRFALSALVALILAGALATLALSRIGESEAIRDARTVTRVLGEGVVEPNLTDELVRGEPQAIAAMDRVIRERVLKDPVARVKIWTLEGRIVYSDERRLIGRMYPLEEEKLAAIEEGKVHSEKPHDLSDPENRYERNLGELLEVYLPVETTSGQGLLLETYQRFGSVASSGRNIWFTFVPAVVAALAFLWLVQIPLAWTLARRLQAGREEREALLHKAIEASDVERRRIAADLHDSVVQDLSGAAFSLAATADRIEAGALDGSAAAVRRAAAEARASVRQLRSLLVEIHPPNLHNVGLAVALSDLVTRLTESGISVRIEIPDGLDLDPEVEALVFRVARETLRNVEAHARARSVNVVIQLAGENVVLSVEDDGRGFSPEEAERQRSKGHFGVSLLAELAAEQGGELTVNSVVGQGTRVQLEVPA